uniref:Gly d 7 n=1 Tax=Glycyphagus domesticus TaxID=105145 RepID=Q1M2M5_GLYDO|nr:Gly d 7 [Glycyphagus domesticus]
MQYLSFSLLVALVGLTVAVGPVFYDDNMANQMVDQIIQSLTTKKELDPFKIESKTIPIDKKVGLIHLKGSITIKNAEITGLSHIARNGDAKIDTANGGFAALLKLGDKNIRVKTDLIVNIGKILHPHLKLESEIGDIDMKLKLALVDGKPELDQSRLTNSSTFICRFTVWDHSIPLVDVIADAFVKYFNPQARKLVTDAMKPIAMKPILVEEIKKLKMG